MEMFLKMSCKSVFKFDVDFRNIEVIKSFNKKKYINCIAGYGIIRATVEAQK